MTHLGRHNGGNTDGKRMSATLHAGRPVCTSKMPIEQADALADRLKQDGLLILYTANGEPIDWTDSTLLRDYCLSRKDVLNVRELSRLPGTYYTTTAMICRFLLMDDGKRVGTIYAIAPMDFDRDLYMLEKRLRSLSFALYSGYAKRTNVADAIRLIDQIDDTADLITELRDQMQGSVYDATASEDNE